MNNVSRAVWRHARAYASWGAEGLIAACGVRRPRIVLILGHMRSGSTLLLHLLQTHPEVAALGERNRSYGDGADLAQLVIATRRAQARPLRRLCYVADQINHNQFTPVPGLLARPRVRVLFLLRAPAAALASLLELSRRFYRGSWTPARAVDYYCERLAGLERLAAPLSRRGQAAFLSYEALTNRPQAVLADLSAFLGLAPQLHAEYPEQPYTGKRGDPGERIRTGRILPAAHVEADIDPALLACATAAHERCCAALAELELGRGSARCA
jgi:hypothetical protein